MSRTFHSACVQTCAGPELAGNMVESGELVCAAHAAGADLICLPEYFSCLDVTGHDLQIGARPEREHPALAHYRKLAAELGVWILLGSIAVRDDAGNVLNRSVLLDAAGTVAARYDKIHMFDVDLGNGESYRESAAIHPGSEAVVAPTPWGQMGLSICYDLRFAYLYRALAQAGAIFLTCPAAFMRTTGQAHWHVLLRSRAIETGCFVFAPSQYGSHGDAHTYGHSLIVDPWGEVLADAGDGPGFALAEIDPAKVGEARRRIPALTHDRTFSSAPGLTAVEA